MHVPAFRFLLNDNNTCRHGKGVNPMSQRNPMRWRSKFGRFVSAYGVQFLAATKVEHYQSVSLYVNETIPTARFSRTNHAV
jgi:hypothetical protein